MELEDTEVNSYIDDMVELLEDETEIKHRPESKNAVKNLLELKQEDFIITTTDEDEIRRVAMAAINEKERELKRTIVDAGNELGNKTAESKHELVGKGLVIKAELEQTGKKLEQKGIELEKQLTMKKIEAEENLEKKLQEKKLELEFKNKVILEQLEQRYPFQTESESRSSLLFSKETQTSAEDSMTSSAVIKCESEYSRQKADFQEKLKTRYEKYVRKVPTLPLQPKRNQENVSDVYVPPWMTVEITDEGSTRLKEIKISMHEIFRNDGKPAKYIYVIGEAGSGKSMFCKILVHFWCIAHSCSECGLYKSDIVKEMGSFKYLFYVSLRHCSDCDSIEKMLEKLYGDPVLGDILQNESDQCLIVLDGLDEWTPERKHNSQFLTPGLPGREVDANFIIITTSRQWKFDALPITDIEVDKKINLRGIDQKEIKDLTEKTVKMLNDTFRKSKNAENCKIDLQSRPVSDISHIPLILQQLIFLWFDDKLRENSKHAIYGSMLALFLEWNTLKSSESQECKMIIQERLIDSPLPDYLCQFDTFRENTSVIVYLSYLAYETLFDKNKETTLTFSRSTLTRLDVPNEVIKLYLNIGILTEEQTVSLHASIRQQSSFSFFHKSMQEYLAAVYVASQFKEMKKLQSDEREHTDVYKKCMKKYFGSCETVVDILEQSNVLTMLCGLEPRLLTNVSEYIYNVATVDRMVVEERNKIRKQYFSDHNRLMEDVQACIFRCIDEVMPNEKNVHTPVYVADLYVFRTTKLVRYSKNIVFQNVLSIEIEESSFGMTERDKEGFYLPLGCLTKSDKLKAMKKDDDLHTDISDERIINAVTEILVTNASTLETISLLVIDKKILQILVPIIPKVRRLVSLQIMNRGLSDVSHEVCLSLSKALNQTTSLQHISLGNYCKQHDQHMIDLSKHRQLQYVDIRCSSFYVVRCNTANLETCMFNVSSSAIMNQVCNSIYEACKLKHLHLHGILIIRHPLIEDRQVTENLIELLPSLISLNTLTLWEFTFTDNIIECPSDMKNLKEIELHSVTMSMATWCKFVDSLPALPQLVQVKIYAMFIGDETIDGYIIHDEKQVADARLYVRENTNAFHVTLDDTYDFRFTTVTKKV